MKIKTLAALFALFPAIVSAQDNISIDPALIPPDVVEKAMALQEKALQDNLPVDIVESVTTEVGARRMGTEGDKRVIAWSQEKFKELDWFSKVAIENAKDIIACGFNKKKTFSDRSFNTIGPQLWNSTFKIQLKSYYFEDYFSLL